MTRDTGPMTIDRWLNISAAILLTCAVTAGLPGMAQAGEWLPTGTWKGSFFREEDPKYQVHPLIARMNGTDTGSVEFPTLGCTGKLKAEFRIGNELQPFYNARELQGGDRCNDAFGIFFNANGTAEYAHFSRKPGFSSTIVAGVLKKQLPGRRERLADYVGELGKNPLSVVPYRESRWLEMVKLAATLDPRPAVAAGARERLQKGNIYLEAYRYEEAVREYHGALLLAPWQGDVYYNLAIALEALGQSAERAEVIDLYRLLAPGKTEPGTVTAEIKEAAALLQARQRAADEERKRETPIKEFITKIKEQLQELNREEARYDADLASYIQDCTRSLSEWEYPGCTARKLELDEWHQHYQALVKEHNRGADYLTKLRDLASAAYDRNDYATALRIWRPFAEKDYPVNQFDLAWMYQHGEGVPEDLHEAAAWYRRAADLGHAPSQYRLAGMYWEGKGVAKDLQTALDWYRKAAEKGNLDAQYAIGYFLAIDSGIPLDRAEAARWLRKAGDRGHADAQFIMGNLYFHGEGVSQDYRQAADWYRKAAAQEHAGALYNLANLYEYGLGMEKDPAEALKFFRRCDRSGNQSCKERIQRLEGK